MESSSYKQSLAFITGAALGDGNLSNPNGRAVRLRISCDNAYPRIIKLICAHLHKVTPRNKISLVPKKAKRCMDISCYSNSWEQLLGWKAGEGSKFAQKVSIPSWVKKEKDLMRQCLRGLFMTDGSMYTDRKYLMLNFTSSIPSLVQDVTKLIDQLKYKYSLCQIKTKCKDKFVIRISSRSKEFIKEINFFKA